MEIYGFEAFIGHSWRLATGLICKWRITRNAQNFCCETIYAALSKTQAHTLPTTRATDLAYIFFLHGI